MISSDWLNKAVNINQGSQPRHSVSDQMFHHCITSQFVGTPIIVSWVPTVNRGSQCELSLCYLAPQFLIPISTLAFIKYDDTLTKISMFQGIPITKIHFSPITSIPCLAVFLCCFIPGLGWSNSPYLNYADLIVEQKVPRLIVQYLLKLLLGRDIYYSVHLTSQKKNRSHIQIW